MALTVTEILDVGNDALLIRAKDGDDEYEARGWMSAITNNFADSAYVTDTSAIEKDDQLANGDGPMLKPGAKPKKMTKAQIGEYALRVVREQNPEIGAKPKKVTFA